jgi:23S rRNA pseudouridine2457 synthase
MSRVIVLNKPYGVLTTFTDPQGRPCLADYVKVPGVYAAGRLDRDSEGVLVLTDDGALQHKIAHPSGGKSKGYWVQVEGVPTDETLARLRAGVLIKGGMTKAARVQIIDPPALWPRTPPVRFRKTIPTHWLELFIVEGKNRQVRRMTAAVGLPCLRLIRFCVGDYRLGELKPGMWREG